MSLVTVKINTLEKLELPFSVLVLSLVFRHIRLVGMGGEEDQSRPPFAQLFQGILGQLVCIDPSICVHLLKVSHVGWKV